jgi:hypothetical protein
LILTSACEITVAGGHMRFSMHNSPLSTLVGFLTVPVEYQRDPARL